MLLALSEFMSEHDWSKHEVIDSLDRNEIGEKLASKIAKRLKVGRSLINQHRDYCGHGLIYADGLYKIICVHDGLVEYSDTVVEFQGQAEFISFLSRQSDWSLSGADDSEKELYTENMFELNNQRLTKKGLIRFAGICT